MNYKDLTKEELFSELEQLQAKYDSLLVVHETSKAMHNKKYKSLFNASPVAISENDFTQAKQYFDSLKDNGVADFKQYFKNHKDKRGEVFKLMQMVKLVDLNKAHYDLYSIKKEEYLPNLPYIFSTYGEEQVDEYINQFVSLMEGNLFFTQEMPPHKTIKGITKNVVSFLQVAPGFEQDLSRVFVFYIDITERKINEQELKESLEINQQLANSTFEAIFFSEKGICTNQNSRAQKMFGYTINETIGKPVTDWIHEDYRKIVKNNMLTNYEKPYYAVAQRKDGSTFPCEIQAKTTMIDKKNIRITALRDISYQKKSEQALKESEERYRILSDATIEGVCVHNKGVIIDASKRLIEIFGYDSLDELIGMNVVNLASESTRDIVKQNSVAGYKLPYEVEGLRKDKSKFPISIFGKVIPLGGKEYRIASVRDISEQKNNELELIRANKKSEESEKNLILLNELTTKMLNLRDMKSIYEFITSSMQKQYPNTIILYNSIDEQKEETCLEAISGLSSPLFSKILSIATFNPVGKYFKLIPAYTESYKTCKLIDFKGGLVKFSVGEFPLSATKAIDKLLGIHKIYTIGITKENMLLGSIHLFTINKKEITNHNFIETFVKQAGIILQIKTAEQALIKSEKNIQKHNLQLNAVVKKEVAKNREKDRLMIIQSKQAAMGEMIGNIAHQWRQPLNDIGLLVQTIPDRIELDKQNTKKIDEIIETTMERLLFMSQTIDDFRNFFRQDKEKGKFSLTESINKTLTLIEANFKNSYIKINLIEQENLFIKGYQNEFSQGLLNILNNARDALIKRKVKNPQVKINTSKQGKTIILTVSDNAGGIPKNIIDKIFEPYFTTKGKQTGTGLGLFISKTIIEKNMSGKLSVRNTKKGAEFKIELLYHN